MTNLFNNELITTKFHGMEQDVYVTTEDRLDSFNNYSSDFQLWLALFTLCVGAFISSAIAIMSKIDALVLWVIFYSSLFLSIVSLIFGLISFFRFKSIKKRMFIKTDNTSSLTDKTS